MAAQDDLTRDRCTCGTENKDMRPVWVEEDRIYVRECPNCKQRWYINNCYRCTQIIFMPHVEVGADGTRCQSCRWYFCPRCGACKCSGQPAAKPYDGPVTITEEGGSYDPTEWEQG